MLRDGFCARPLIKFRGGILEIKGGFMGAWDGVACHGDIRQKFAITYISRGIISKFVPYPH